MIRRALTWIAILATIGAAAFIANAVAQGTHTVEAVGVEWEPSELDANPGDTVSFEFPPAPDLPHNVAIRLPNDEAPKNEGLIYITEGHPGCNQAFPYLCPAGTAPVSYEVPPEVEDGAILYICTLHSVYNEGADRWEGMVGTIGEDDDPDPRLENPSSAPGPPWEIGTEPPRMLGAKVKGLKRGVRLKLRVTHPGRVNVRLRRGGKVALKRNVKKLRQGANVRKIRSKRLRGGRYQVQLRYFDRWGTPAQPRVVKRKVRVRY
ncbi:MAG TPA: hypothetical protein VK919_01840 [Solirubrobacterales bacterium]|nr:hypothetical protein [Solirubrobacterales bacterium]